MRAITATDVPITPPRTPPRTSSKRGSFLAPVQRCFRHLSEGFNSSRSGQFYARRIDPYVTVTNDMIQVVVNLTNAWVLNVFLSFFRNATNATSSWKHYDSLIKVIRAAKILAIVTLPFALYSICKEAWSACTGEDRLQASLRMLEGLSWMSDSLAIFLNGLQMTGIAVVEAAKWVFSLSIAAVLFSTATLTLNGIQLKEGRQFLSELNQKQLTAIDGKTSRYIETHLGGEQIKQGLGRIANATIDHQKIALQHLQTRVTAKNFVHTLAILSSAVSLIGLSLLFVPTIDTVGYGFLAFASGIKVLQFFLDRHSQNQLKKRLASV